MLYRISTCEAAPLRLLLFYHLQCFSSRQAGLNLCCKLHTRERTTICPTMITASCGVTVSSCTVARHVQRQTGTDVNSYLTHLAEQPLSACDVLDKRNQSHHERLMFVQNFTITAMEREVENSPISGSDSAAPHCNKTALDSGPHGSFDRSSNFDSQMVCSQTQARPSGCELCRHCLGDAQSTASKLS